METQVRNPQQVFTQSQQLVVPLFQRRYVWSEHDQWNPLWEDLIRITEHALANPAADPEPHFLGAVVLQQQANTVGSMQVRAVIDGQQRLTTLQLLIDALQGELASLGVDKAATRLESLIENPEAFRERAEDRFKVWPTSLDRPAYNAVMAAPTPVEYSSLGYHNELLIDAHRFFAESARRWLHEDGETAIPARCNAIEYAVRELLQLVVIELSANEDPQEIFETLNARGTPLTAADLVKNFVFQRLIEQQADVETIYEHNWKHLETEFWETEIGRGDRRFSRSSLFLNHWLVARTGDQLVTRWMFRRFKSHVDYDCDTPMAELVGQIDRAARLYRDFTESATEKGPIDRWKLFAYRSDALEIEVFKPVILWLGDPEQEAIAQDQLHKALDVLESWLIRRMLVRATQKRYNTIAVDLVNELRDGDRANAGDVLERYLAAQTADTSFWPDDTDVSRELASLAVYKKLSRKKLRMVLEAIEDHRRGFTGEASKTTTERVPRGTCEIEHIMPQTWRPHWPPGTETDFDRDQIIQTLGNLTLLMSALNGSISNSAWPNKRKSVSAHDVLLLNKDLIDSAADSWDEDAIRRRTKSMIADILAIWPVPENHVTQHRESASATGDGKYAALGRYLAEHGEPQMKMGFIEIEAVLGTPLPKSAWAHQAWWANTASHVEGRAWLGAGYRVQALDLNAHTVEFVRDESI